MFCELCEHPADDHNRDGYCFACEKKGYRPICRSYRAPQQA